MRHRRGQRQALGPAPQYLVQQQAVRLAVAAPAVRQPLRPGQAVPLLPVPQPGHRNAGPLGHLADRKHGRAVAGGPAVRYRLHQVDDSNLITLTREYRVRRSSDHHHFPPRGPRLRRQSPPTGHPAPREPPRRDGPPVPGRYRSGPVAGIGGVPLHGSRALLPAQFDRPRRSRCPAGQGYLRRLPGAAALPGVRAGHRAGVRHLGRLRRGGTARPAPRAERAVSVTAASVTGSKAVPATWRRTRAGTTHKASRATATAVDLATLSPVQP